MFTGFPTIRRSRLSGLYLLTILSLIANMILPSPNQPAAYAQGSDPRFLPVKDMAGQEWVRPTDGAVMVYVPTGEFLMGSTRESEPCAYADDMPQHRVYLDGYWIDKYEVTNAQFAQFVQATGYKSEGDWRANFTPGKERYPVVNVSWNDATAYAKWVGGQLPTEARWEKAARGADSRVYPWGNEWDPSKANVGKGWSGSPAPVGDYPGDVSPYGCHDMAGNIMEWVFDWYGKYNGAFQRNPTGPVSGFARMLRGGSFVLGSEFCNARCAARNAYFHQNDAVPDVGFRTVLVQPVWQPRLDECGREIAYVRDGDLWIVNTDGKEERQLTYGEGVQFRPAWSPDGRKIAYTCNLHICVFDLVTGQTIVKACPKPEGCADPSWSPDGKQLAYGYNNLRGDGGDCKPGGIAVMDANGQNSRDLICKAGFPAWSPDGSKIAAIDVSGLSIFSTNGSKLQTLNNEQGGYPTWSPDGSQIAYNISPSGPEVYLALINVADGKKVDLRKLGYALSPTWSPDGQQITFWGGGDGIFIVKVDGSNLHKLTDGETPAWQPCPHVSLAPEVLGSKQETIKFLSDPKFDFLNFNPAALQQASAWKNYASQESKAQALLAALKNEFSSRRHLPLSAGRSV